MIGHFVHSAPLNSTIYAISAHSNCGSASPQGRMHARRSVIDRSLDVEYFHEPVTSLALRRSGGVRNLACTAAQGFATLDGKSRLSYLSKPLPDGFLPFVRFNDGGCDSRGRYFAGTIESKDPDIPGQLLSVPLVRDSKSRPVLTVQVAGMIPVMVLAWLWTKGHSRYFTDSLVNRIYAYDFDSEDGSISNRRTFVDAMAQGYPQGTFADGLCLDKDGFVWSARWGGCRVVRYSPDGTPDLERVVSEVTSTDTSTGRAATNAGIAGLNNDQLFVTSAHCGANGGDASRQESYPDSGHLFVVDFCGEFEGRARYEFSG
ncbi:regucalcin [Salix suchowensis]|nr:regucalcin [Salix suchowensis]